MIGAINSHIRNVDSQRGAVMAAFVLLLLMLFGFAALAIEAGRWYAIKVELSKAVDAAALAAAKNISNPYVDLEDLVDEVGRENFTPGLLGSLPGSLSFTMTRPDEHKVAVIGSVATDTIMAQMFGIDTITVSSSGVGEKNKVEIMLVLDRSGSMSGPMSRPTTAASSFVDFFADTQAEDKMGLVTYATGVVVNAPLSTNFVSNIKSKINAISIDDVDLYTNMEDALDQCDDDTARNGSATTTLTDQTGVPGDQRVLQYIVFFTDGNTTACRGNYIDSNGDTVIAKFRRNGVDYDGVLVGQSSTDGDYLYHPYTGQALTASGTNVRSLPTGDGKPTSTTACKSFGRGYANSRWSVFEHYALSGHGVEECKIGGSNNMNSNGVIRKYVTATGDQMARDHADVLKSKHIKIYVIGLGSVDEDALTDMASDPDEDYYFYAPSSDKLEAIFKRIAKEIKLRLAD